MTGRSMPPGDLPEDKVGELHALYREGAAGEPGAVLDQRILAAARADLAADATKRSRAPAPWWKAWLKPASIVAVAVLGLSLTWQVIDEQERERRQEIDGKREQPKAADTAGQSLAPPPPAAAPAKRSQAPALNERASADQSARAPAPATTPATAEPQAFPLQEERAKSKAGASGALARPAPLPAAPAAVPAEKKNLLGDTNEARAIKDRRDDRSGERGEAAAGAPAKLEAARRAEAPDASADALGKSAVDATTPQAWLQQIRELHAAGHEAEAAQSLSRFQARYPDFALPDDLKALK